MCGVLPVGVVGRVVGTLMLTSPFYHMVFVDDLRGMFMGPGKFELFWLCMGPDVRTARCTVRLS